MTTGRLVTTFLRRHLGWRLSRDRQPRRAVPPFLIAAAIAAFALAGCAADGSAAVEGEPRTTVPTDRAEDRPPSPPPNHDVAPKLQDAARSQLGDRYGGFWVDRSVMVVAVVGGPSQEDVAALEPVTEGLPHQFVTVDTPYARLQEVADEIFSGPLSKHISMIGADQPSNSVQIGVATAGAAVDEVRNDVTRRYSDIKFVVEFSPPDRTLSG